MTLIVRHILAYASPKFEITSNLFNLANSFCHIQGNLSVSVTCTPILANRVRSRRICLGVRLYVTLIVKHIVTYALLQLVTS